MAPTKSNAAFQRDKSQFFQQIPRDGRQIDQLIWVDQRVQTIGYSFLHENKDALLDEFTTTWRELLQKTEHDRTTMWAYAYYCASLLENFHTMYGQTGSASEYSKIKQNIITKAQGRDIPNLTEPQFLESMYNSFVDGFNSLLKAPFHVSKMRDHVAYSNLCRIYWAFCRLTLTGALRIADAMGFINKLDAILGTHTNVENIISIFEAPIGVINYFSVGFFLFRFAIDAGLLIKHTFFPSELEKRATSGCEISKFEYLPGPATLEEYRNTYIVVPNEEHENELELYYIPKAGNAIKLNLKDQAKFKKAIEAKMKAFNSTRLTAEEIKQLITDGTIEEHAPEGTTAWERFKHELYKRHCNFANDLVWATVNLLTNFNTVFGISGPAAGAVTAVFLCFDVAMAFYKCHLAKKEYMAKRAQLEQELDGYLDPKKYKRLSQEERLMHIDMLTKQLKTLEINYKTKESTFYFSAAAAALLMIGFTAALVFNPGLIAVAGFFVCTLAVAMYLSTGSYTKYKEKSLYLEQAERSGQNIALARQEYETARNDFIFNMVKNTVVPPVLIATFAVCWPAAVILTALYVGYEIYHAYTQHTGKQEAKQLALAAPEKEVDEVSKEQEIEPNHSSESGFSCCFS